MEIRIWQEYCQGDERVMAVIAIRNILDSLIVFHNDTPAPANDEDRLSILRATLLLETGRYKNPL